MGAVVSTTLVASPPRTLEMSSHDLRRSVAAIFDVTFRRISLLVAARERVLQVVHRADRSAALPIRELRRDITRRLHL